jgi:hypothetical protein
VTGDGADWTRFWELIDLGRKDPEALERRIGEMTEAELVEFFSIWEQTVADLKDDEFTEHMPYPHSEDTLDDIAKWVVGQGSDFYEDVMLDPSKMPTALPPGEENPGWGGVAYWTYRDRYGAPIPIPDEPPPDEGSA